MHHNERQNPHQERDSRLAAGIRWPNRPGARVILLSALVSAGTIAWEYAVLHGYQASDLARKPLYYIGHALLDLGMLLPVALLVLMAGRWLARRIGPPASGRGSVLAAAACASVLLTLLAVPNGALRVVMHQQVDERLVAGSEAGVLLPSRFCSFSRGTAARDAEDPASGAAVGGLLIQGARSALMDQVVVFPLLLIGFSLLSPPRRDAWRPMVLRAAQVGRRAVFAGPVVAIVAPLAWLMLSPPPPEPGGVMPASNVRRTESPDRARKRGTTDRRQGRSADTRSRDRAMITSPEPEHAGACSPQLAERTFDVSAVHVEMTLNRFGDHDPGAYMYVLDENIAAVRNQETMALPERVSLGLRQDAIQPLILRGNLGECVLIRFTNRLSTGPASMHIHGLSHTVDNAGSRVGYNPNTFADPGETISYAVTLPGDPEAERSYYFHDHGASRERVSHGLFGALVAEPAGSIHYDVESGLELIGNNWEAIIVPPDGPAFREFVIMYHEVGDENFDGILNAEGDTVEIIDETTGTYRPNARAINYRSEPFSNRLRLKKDKSQGYGSYMFGDPATPIPRSYLGEPTKTRLMHGGSEVFHVHHLHGGGDRWRRNPKADPNNDIAGGLTKRPAQDVFSTHLDSQSIGPGTSYNLEHECGAGGCQQAAGDFLYHCHIGHHYLAGMWSFWRVFDTLQEGLAPLPDRAPPSGAVNSAGLVGLEVEGKTLLPAAQVTNPVTQRSLEEFIEAQLPPQGQRLDDGDATVWDWQRSYTAAGLPLYLGEPEDASMWANYASDAPGLRPEILFNPSNGRYAWPLMRPHLGKRPPFAPNGHTGAPWLGEDGSAARPDGLCPGNDVVPNPDQQIRQYPITAISLPIQITPEETDESGMIFVLGDEKQDVLDGSRLAQPLAIRSNVGDCVDILLTSELDGDHEELRSETVDGVNTYSKVNMHTHFVQFDPQASDGVITGMSYEQSVRPYSSEGRTLEADVPAGASMITVTHVDRLRPGVWLGVGLGEGMCESGSRMCTEVRRIASIAGNTILLDGPLDLDHDAGEAVGVEFVRYAWYSDVDTGTVFWHDHVNFKTWDRGLFGAHIIEPAGSTYHDPVTGDEVRSGTIVDIHTPPEASVGAGQQGSFREFMLFHHNRTNDSFGLNLGDTGASINLRSEPLESRPGDPAHVFASVSHGDPMTPIPRAYAGDPFVFRHLGVIERVGGIRVTGHRFRMERWAEEGALSDTSPLGISERFDLVLDGGAGGPAAMAGDYLYYSTVARDLRAGAWGLLRVHDTGQSDLQPLPDRDIPAGGAGFPWQSDTGGTPEAAGGPGEICPAGAPVRSYEVEFGPAYIVTSDAPVRVMSGYAFMPLGTSNGNRANLGAPIVREPMVLRVNQGECLEVDLTNRHPDASASLSPGELLFDPQGSYGAAIGYNADSTVPPGGTRTYRFYADKELGSTYFLNLANLDTLAHGGFGGLVVEPEGSIHLDPYTGGPARPGPVADIVSPSGNFREFVALFHDEDRVIGQSRMPYPRNVHGFTGIGYSANRLDDRGMDTAPDRVFDSYVHGDPRQVLQAHRGDPVRFRVAAPWAEQMHVFSLEGHRWPQEPGMYGSEQVFSRLLAPGYSFDAPLTGGAGGDYGSAGDFLFQDHRVPFQDAGLWGMLSVLDESSGNIRQLGQSRRPSRPVARGMGKAPLGQVVGAIKKMEEPPGPLTVHSAFASADFEPGDLRGELTLPMRKAWVNSLDQQVWFVLSDVSDQEFAEAEGVLWSRGLAESNPLAVEEASFENGRWVFEEDPGRVAYFGEAGEVVPPIANPDYSPLKRIVWNGREVIVNAPMIVWGNEPGQEILIDHGGCDPLIRINPPSPFFVGNGPDGCTPDEQPLERYEGGQALSIDIKPGCEHRLDTRQCASVTMKAQIAIHRRDLFSYYVVFDASKPPPAGFMGLPHAPKLANLSPATTEPFNTSAGASKAVGHIMQFRNGVPIPDGGPKRFQPGLTSYSSPVVNDYSPMWHITWLFYDCNENEAFYLEDRNISFGATPVPGSGIPGFDPADPRHFSPFGMDDRGLDCSALARQVTGNPDGFIYVDELEQLKIDGWVEETQAPDGWTGFIGGTPPLQAPLIVNCPTHISVDLRQ